MLDTHVTSKKNEITAILNIETVGEVEILGVVDCDDKDGLNKLLDIPYAKWTFINLNYNGKIILSNLYVVFRE